MIDYYLKFTNKEEADAVLYRIEGAVEANEEMGAEAVEGYLVANYDNIDIIGTIYNPTGEVETIEDMEVPVMVALDGYHVNVRHSVEAPELNAYAVTPTNPRRIWAGDK
jgi:hypothetical protein